MPISRTVKLLTPVIIALISLPAFCLQEGYASWYGGKFNGRYTSSGEVFDTDVKTAAHRTLPFGSIVRVVNVENGIIDLSRAAAEELGMVSQGVAKVSLEVVDLPRSPAVYAVQVGSYSMERNAEAARRTLEGAGFAVALERNESGNIRVRVTGVAEKEVDAVKRR